MSEEDVLIERMDGMKYCDFCRAILILLTDESVRAEAACPQ